MEEGEAVTRYLFDWRSDLLTEDEAQTWRFAWLQEQALVSGGPVGEGLRRKAEEVRTEATEALLREGVATFQARVRERILDQYGDGILNRCPRCRGLCRTLRAHQCPVCFFDWH